MANRSYHHEKRTMSPAPSEPEVRRWPHPIPQPCVTVPKDSTLHYIRCALSYQNEILCEIKTLLEQLAIADSDNGKK